VWAKEENEHIVNYAAYSSPPGQRVKAGRSCMCSVDVSNLCGDEDVETYELHEPLQPAARAPAGARSGCSSRHSEDLCYSDDMSRVGNESEASSWLGSLAMTGLRGTARRPDFNGVWLCHDVAGDIDGFLRDLGVDAGMRAAASQADYGVGNAQITIGQADQHFVMKPAGPAGFTQRFIVNGCPQVTEGGSGPSCVVPTWEGDILKLDVDRIVIRRYRVSGRDMRCEATTAGGASASWSYRRKL
jgi:hypothetical protein